MKLDYTQNELIHHAYKIGKANNSILTRVEIEEPWLKMYRVSLKDVEEEVEYSDTGKKMTKIKDLTQCQEYEKLGGKLCLCDYMKEYRDKMPYYNRQSIIEYGLPLYDNS